jgi:hypothetical protein
MAAQNLDCNVCHELFEQQEDLDAHRKSKHSEEPKEAPQSATADIQGAGSWQAPEALSGKKEVQPAVAQQNKVDEEIKKRNERISKQDK